MLRTPVAFALACTLALPVVGVSGGSASAAPSALSVGPPDTVMVLALTRLGNADIQLTQLRKHLQDMGLADPGIDRLYALAGKHLNLKKPGELVRAIGLNPEGSVAFYQFLHEGRLESVVAADVADVDRFAKFLGAAAKSNAKELGATVRVKKTREGAATLLRLELEGEPVFHTRVVGGVGVFSDHPEGVKALALEGGKKIAALTARPPAAESVGLSFWVDPRRLREHERDAPDFFEYLESFSATASVGPDGLKMDVDASISEDLEPFLGPGKPGPAGAKARALMQRMAGDDAQLWFRYSFDLKAVFELARTILADALTDVVAGFKDETQIDLEKDVVEVFTGDVMLVSRDGLADMALVFGVKDADRAAKTMSRLLDASLDAPKEGRHAKTRFVKEGNARLYRTEYWHGDAKKKRVRELRTAYWGVRDHALVMGATPATVKDALTRAGEAAKMLPPLLAGGRGFSDKDVLASYALFMEPLNLARQLLPTLRANAAGGEGAEHDIIGTLDLMQAIYDQIVDGSALISLEGRRVSASFHYRGMPRPGAAGYDKAADQAWQAAMKRRYEGRVRTSNEALLALSERYPGTVYAKKARTYALGGDGLSGMLAASVLSGFWLFTGMQVMGEAVPMAPAPAMSACTALEQITCPGGPQPDPVACRIAKRRTEGDCQAALTGTGP